jgi:hypothetical protein
MRLLFHNFYLEHVSCICHLWFYKKLKLLTLFFLFSPYSPPFSPQLVVFPLTTTVSDLLSSLFPSRNTLKTPRDHPPLSSMRSPPPSLSPPRVKLFPTKTIIIGHHHPHSTLRVIFNTFSLSI